MLFKTDIICW